MYIWDLLAPPSQVLSWPTQVLLEKPSWRAMK